MRFALTLIVASLALPACGAARFAVRDSTTYATEHAAALARQQEAATALHAAALDALERSDYEACRLYAEPALLIDASAEVQTYRALWLAGLPYPVDGVTPKPGTEQPDPGATPDSADADTVCAED